MKIQWKIIVLAILFIWIIFVIAQGIGFLTGWGYSTPTLVKEIIE